MSVRGEVHFVLYGFEELLRDGSARVVVNAECVYFELLAIENFLGTAYVAYSS